MKVEIMKVGLIGFGKTGRSVASVLLNNKDVQLQWVVRRSHKLEHRSVPEFLGIESDEPGLIYSSSDITCDQLLSEQPVDVLIDFSSQDGIDYYADAVIKHKVNVVSAISAYPKNRVEQIMRLGDHVKSLWSPNITLGINFLILAGKVLKDIDPKLDIDIIEEHFREKPEVSGTAVKIAQALDVSDSEIKSIRAGGIIGNHEVLFGFPYQVVRLRHESISREAFGNGAVFAAQHLIEQDTGFYSLEELMHPYFAELGKSRKAVLPSRENSFRHKVASGMRKIANLIE